MSYNVLVTGGAGFIGSFIVDELVKRGHTVRIFDKLVPQVHRNGKPAHINPKAEFINGDVCDREAFAKALKDIDVVFHEAAEVGVGQSMYEITRYVDANVTGTANLLDIVVNDQSVRKRIKKIVVASSMSAYGEGMYSCPKCGDVMPHSRHEHHLKNGQWELVCQQCSSIVRPIPTPERKHLHTTSIYAITKKAQEEMVLNIGQAYNIPAVALRYFNVYGPRQSISNPYTGVVAIFMSKIKNGLSPIIFEDGNQTRDFVSVHDIVQANMLAMEKDEANYESFNVGGGSRISLNELAALLAQISGKNITPVITHEFRKGDIRHCFADISKIRDKLGYKPSVQFKDGLKELYEWSVQEEAIDLTKKATEELKSKGLLFSGA